MKRISIVLIFVATLLMGACKSCSTEETPEEIRVQDSLAEIDRNESLDEADRLLREADSIAQLQQDSLAKVEDSLAKAEK